jgi:hypothetical protein
LAFSQNGALRLTEPKPSKDGTIITSEPALNLQGTLAWKGGDRRVLWESNRGFSDLATVRLADDGRTILWSSSAPVPLRLGVNHVRIKALGQSRAATSVNIYYAPKSPLPAPVLKTTTFHGKQITYEVRDGFAIYQDDIILGKAADVAAAAAAGPTTAKSKSGLRSDAVTITSGISSSVALWNEVSGGVIQIPYVITNNGTTNLDNVNTAISNANAQLTGVIHWVAQTTQANYVNFDFDSGTSNGICEATVGMVGGDQYILVGRPTAPPQRSCTRWGMRWACTMSSHAPIATPT